VLKDISRYSEITWISKIIHWIILPPVRTVSVKYQKDS